MVRKRKKKSKNYFTQETEDYIVKYNNEPDSEVRSKIYETHIHYPFFKLTQNIIHTFKFYHTEVENLEHLQHEIITFLLSKMHLFDPTRGAKAYSYFGTIVKRWLILYNTKNYTKKIKKVEVDFLKCEKSTQKYNIGDDKVKSAFLLNTSIVSLFLNNSKIASAIWASFFLGNNSNIFSLV